MNPRIGFLLAFVVSVWPAVSSGQDLDFLVKQAKGQVKVHRDNAGNAEVDGWFQAKSTEGHFRVRLPAKFVDYTELKPGKNGETTNRYVISLKVPEPLSCSIAETYRECDVPPLRQFDEVKRDALASTLTKIQSLHEGMQIDEVRKFDLNGFPALDIRVKGNGGILISRNVLLPDRGYQINLRYPIESHDNVSSQAKKILDSFQLDPPRQADYPSEEEAKRLMVEYLVKLKNSGRLKMADKTADKEATPPPQ